MIGMGFRGIDWTQVAHDISGRGYAKLPKLIDSNLFSSLKKSYEMNNFFGIAL
mgnify:CR=1 FL=1